MRGAKPNLKAERSPTVLSERAPAWLSKDAKAEWKRITPLLVERRILSDADLGSLENYCVAIGRVRQIEATIQRASDLDPVLFRMQNAAMQTARQLAAELGLTPVSRSRPAVNEDPDDDDTSPLA